MGPRQAEPLAIPDQNNRVRKRVCKACDRCRMRKSKCDTSSPCARCRADNSICVFGGKKKVPEKVHPKGYVETLEQQQVWLVHGLQELYRRSVESGGWTGEHPKLEPSGQPLIHNLLLSLGTPDNIKGESFQDALEGLQQENGCTQAGLKRPELAEAGPKSLQSPVSGSQFSHEASYQRILPPTPPTSSLSACISDEIEPEIIDMPRFAHSTPMHNEVSPMMLSGSQEWPDIEFNLFDDIDLWATPETLDICSVDQPFTSSTFNWQFFKDLASQEPYLESKS